MPSFRPLPEYADFIRDIAPLCVDNYYDFVFQFNDAHYETRVDMTGFRGGRKVLDAGCGYGQWAAALARCNEEVVAIDAYPNMVEICRRYQRRRGVTNVQCLPQSLPHLDFTDESFDSIWCWSVFMFVNPDATLKEFQRLLKPGGRLLIGGCNGAGRWLFKAWQALKPPRNWPVFKACVRALTQGHRADASVTYHTTKSFRYLCKPHGFELISADYDGHLDLSGKQRQLPMFPRTFLGFSQNLEFLAEKVCPTGARLPRAA
jgi:ubiquinone/menaquinone biosynthesis C-methylase UbiE